LMAVYKLFRDDFSSTYLEMIKPSYGSPVDGKTHAEAIGFLDVLLRLLHPFMPFITEELWQHLSERRQGESIMYAAQPAAGEIDSALLAEVDQALEIINGIRGVRARKNIPPREQLRLLVIGSSMPESIRPLVGRLGGVETFEDNAVKDPTANIFMIGAVEYAIPQSSDIDVEAEIARIEKDIAYQEGFLKSVEKKLSNERFVSNAPEAVVAAERKKQSDALAKLEVLRASLAALK
ncbi:MAG: class I tRNA ligase family protein, partial [Muribaculaceae bacterium]|nr:class I tRNA ligase family protein [Muribaculaceae bacterium]